MQNKEGLDLESSFNLIVNLARQSKLTHEEHGVVDKAVDVVLEEINKYQKIKKEKEEKNN